MKREFADLHLCLNTRNSTAAQGVMLKVAALGYDLVGIPFTPETPETEISNFRKICKDAKVDLASRVDLVPKTRNQLIRLLAKLRRRFEVICVICENKEVARQAAKDRRVDMLSFHSLEYKGRFFDWAEAELASSGTASLEVDVKPLLLLEGPTRVRLLSYLRREVSIAMSFRVPIVVSSGVGTELLLRKPRELAALVSLLGFNETSALDVVSTNPIAIVTRNRQKLSRDFVAPGIRVIKEGGDC